MSSARLGAYQTLPSTPIQPLLMATLRLGWLIFNGHYDVATFLIERGADIFAKLGDGRRAIVVAVRNEPTNFMGPRVLQHAKDLRVTSVKQSIILSKACSIDTTPPPTSSSSANPPPQRRSARHQAPRRVASVKA
jgi:hypothetical protein